MESNNPILKARDAVEILYFDAFEIYIIAKSKIFSVEIPIKKS